MLKPIRKIFGCYSDPALNNDYEEISNDKCIIINNTCDDIYQLSNTKNISDSEKRETITNIINAVIEDKEKTFISYVEDAYDSVTNNQFKYIKYRIAKRKN